MKALDSSLNSIDLILFICEFIIIFTRHYCLDL
jgi:hypothetical protein